MMLVSVTCVPPSCFAMLPQKFSAATTTIFLLDPAGAPAAVGPGADAAGAVEQPAATARAATATAGNARRYVRSTHPIGGTLQSMPRRDTRRADAMPPRRCRCQREDDAVAPRK